MAWAKAFVWANSNGMRECDPDLGLNFSVNHSDPFDEMPDAMP